MTKKNSFEEKMKKFEEIIEKLEEGEISLDDSIEFFQKGMNLSKELSIELDEVEGKINEILIDTKGIIKEKNIKSGE
jgi:exodeoxyribonuclease VII small subunit